MDKETKATVKQAISSSLKFIAPKTSKLIFDDLGTIKKTKFGFNLSDMKSVDNGDEHGNYHKSYKQIISSSLNNVDEHEIDKMSREDNDEPLFKSSSQSSGDRDSSVNIPYFNNPRSISVNRNSRNRRVITNNFYANNKATNVTNKLLLNSMKANIEMQQKSTSAILNNISVISKFQQETTLSFYNDVSDKLAYIGNSIENISRLYTDGQENLFKTDRDNLISTIKSNGLMFSMLGGIFKDNYNNPDKDILEGVFKDTNSKKLVKTVKDKIFGKEESGGLEKIFSRIKGFDDAVGNLPINLNYWLNSMKGGSKFKKNIFGTEVDLGRLLGNAFGMDMKVDKRLSTNKYEKGPVAYNGIANRAITNVIPSLLSKILSTLNHKEEIIYDYDAGKFTDKSLVRQEREDRLRNTVKNNLSGDIKNILGKDINSKDKELLESVFYNIASEGKTVSDYKGSITGNRDLDKKLRDYYNNPKYKNSLNKNIFNTSTDMNEFFTEFTKDLAGQMAMDYSKNTYSEDKKERRRSVLESLEDFEMWDEETSYKGKLTSLLNGGLNKLNKASGSKPLSGKEARNKTGSIYDYNDKEDMLSRGTRKSSVVAGVENDSTIAFLKTLTTGNSFNVTVQGGTLDSIKGIVSTRENVLKDNNASYKDNLAKAKANDEDDDADRSNASANVSRMNDEQNSRITSFEQRRDELLDNLQSKLTNAIKNSPIGDTLSRAKLKVVNTLKKTKVGKVFGKFFSSPQAVEDAGMTPVYVMGTAVGGMASGVDGTGSKMEETIDFSGLNNILGKLGGKGGSLLTSIGGKLSSKGGKLGKLGSILNKSGGKLSQVSAEKRARAALESGDSNILNKMLKEGYTEDEISALADGTTASDLKNKVLSSVKGNAKNLGGKALSKSGSLATSLGGKLATKGGMLGKAGSLLGNVGGKLATSGAGMLAEGAGTSAGAGILGSLGSLGASAGGMVASAGSALAGLAPILGPVAVAGLATFALVKIGPKIVKGIANIGKNVLDGVAGLGKKAKDTAKGIVKGAGKVAKGAVDLGVKALGYTPLGLAVKGAKFTASGIASLFKSKDEDSNKSPYGDYNFKTSNINTTSGDGLGDVSSYNPLQFGMNNLRNTLATAKSTKNAYDSTIFSPTYRRKAVVNGLIKTKDNLGGLLNTFRNSFGGNNSSEEENTSSISNGVKTHSTATSSEKETVSSAKKLTIADVKKKGKYIINSLLTKKFVLS